MQDHFYLVLSRSHGNIIRADEMVTLGKSIFRIQTSKLTESKTRNHTMRQQTKKATRKQSYFMLNRTKVRMILNQEITSESPESQHNHMQRNITEII